MLSKAKVAVCSDIRTKHSTQSERHVEFLSVKPWRYVKKPLDFKRLKRLHVRRNWEHIFLRRADQTARKFRWWYDVTVFHLISQTVSAPRGRQMIKINRWKPTALFCSKKKNSCCGVQDKGDCRGPGLRHNRKLIAKKNVCFYHFGWNACSSVFGICWWFMLLLAPWVYNYFCTSYMFTCAHRPLVGKRCALQ